jgi:hypothetical protein
MKMMTRRSFFAGAAGTALIPSSPRAKAARFDVYDSLLFVDKPDLSPYGLKRARTVYESELWPPRRSATPNEAAVRSRAQAVLAEGVNAEEPVILDVEQYSVDTRLDGSHIEGNTSAVDANIIKLEQIIGWFKDEAPTLQVGFYDIFPVEGLSVTATNNEIISWQKANSHLNPFIAHVDALYPSVYTSVTDPTQWVTYAHRFISEAKKVAADKPIRPFIWPQYHDVMRSPLAGTYIHYDYWMLQLKTIKDAGVSGAIIWGGYNTPWDDTQGWWHATLDFLAKN